MKKVLKLMIVLLMGTKLLNAQDSDHQKVEQFRTGVEVLNHQINNAITSKQLGVIYSELTLLKETSADIEKLINRALFPISYQSIIESLESSLINNEHRLLLIEHQREQLFDLTNQLTAHRSEISRLYTISDSLKREILSSEASEARLSQMISSYRKQLTERDKLVFEMIDSLLITNQKDAFQTISDGDSRNFSVSGAQNPLIWIEAFLDENASYTKHQNRLLDVEDHIRMYALQQHFEGVWNKVGDDLITVYGGENKNEFTRAIDGAIRDWKISASQRMWTSIDHYLDNSNFDLQAFDSKESFYSSLQAFIDNGITSSEDEVITSDGFSQYEEMAEFWNSTFKNDWLAASARSRLMKEGEMNIIDAALTQWEQEARPIHPMLIAIFSIMIISLTGFILIMVRSNSMK